jgi:GPI-anchor transamidase subunit GAA1
MFPSIIVIFVVWVYAHMLYPRENLDAVTAPTTPAAPAVDPKAKPRKPKQPNQPPESKEKVKTKKTAEAAPVVTPLSSLFALPQFTALAPTTPALLKALNLCTFGTLVSVLAVANFSLSALIAVLAILPLCLIPVSLHRGALGPNGVEEEKPMEGWRAITFKVAGAPIRYGDLASLAARASVGAWIALVSPMGLVTLAAKIAAPGLVPQGVLDWLKRMAWESTVLKTWFFPIVCVLYLPLVLQGVVVCFLPA